ncbi:substrate-binding domain-containing protein [Vibrio salinus]|uniref:substrate-binding domain-containing protein n=1 Tax=Vibrio salinus TaxID=2899784 RepID=UPI001E478666|nr:substrate-binding domain-containing protein [Vibrio salinus]MCE0495991.1 substrate-binding domain-containing protein [Vibrio salinus]
MNKRKLFSVFAFIMASLVSIQANAKSYTIGVAVANLQADFFNQIKQSVEAETLRLGDKMVAVDAHGDSATQVNQIQDLITRKVDAIIYIPAGATAASVPIKAAHKAGIPVIAVDRNPEGTPGDTFVATDSVAAAHILANYVAKITNGKGNIGLIQGQIGTTPQIEREKGFNQGLANFPNLKIVEHQASTMWMQDEGFKIGQDMLLRNPSINVFFGEADALALGGAQAAKVANQKVVTVGFDGDPAGLRAVRDGVLAATITQQTQYMGRLAVRSAIDLIEGRYVPAEQKTAGILTTKENVEQFIKSHP